MKRRVLLVLGETESGTSINLVHRVVSEDRPFETEWISTEGIRYIKVMIRDLK